MSVEEITGEGDSVTARGIFSTDGKPVANWIAFYRFSDGKIVDDWYCSRRLKD